MIALAIADPEDGVGKVAMAHALGVCLARNHGRRVPLMDCGSQASLTRACGVKHAQDRSLAQVLGILVAFHEPRLLHRRDTLATMQKAGLPLLHVTVGRSWRVAEAAGDGESVVAYEPDNKRAREHRELGRVVAERLESNDA